MDNKQAINETLPFNPPEYGRKAPFSSSPDGGGINQNCYVSGR
jgi:hypothetical protein